MKAAIRRVAGIFLIGWGAYILINSDEAVRVNRVCMPFGDVVKLADSVAESIDGDAVGNAANERPLSMLESCREFVWNTVHGNKRMPSFSDSDPVFGEFSPTAYGSNPAVGAAHPKSSTTASTSPMADHIAGDRL